jgi:hypothetical protein
MHIFNLPFSFDIIPHSTTKVNGNDESCLLLVVVVGDSWIRRTSLVEYCDDVAWMVCSQPWRMCPTVCLFLMYWTHLWTGEVIVSLNPVVCHSEVQLAMRLCAKHQNWYLQVRQWQSHYSRTSRILRLQPPIVWPCEQSSNIPETHARSIGISTSASFT